MEKRLTKELNNLFGQATQEVLNELNARGRLPSSPDQLKAILRGLFNIENDVMETTLEGANRAAEYGKNRVISTLNQRGDMSVSLDKLPKRVSNILRDDIFEASQNTMRRITGNVQQTLQTAYEQGVGIDDAADMLKDQFSTIENFEAERIARTETNSASTLAELETERELGIEFHQWWTGGDERVRGNDPQDEADHVMMHGQIVRLGDEFSNGLTRPGDKNGPLIQWINCRCRLIPYIMPQGKKPPRGKRYFYENELVAA